MSPPTLTLLNTDVNDLAIVPARLTKTSGIHLLNTLTLKTNILKCIILKNKSTWNSSTRETISSFFFLLSNHFTCSCQDV